MSKITIDTDNLDYWITYLLIKKYTILDEETTEKLIRNVVNDKNYCWNLRGIFRMLTDHPFFVIIDWGFVKQGCPEGIEFWRDIYSECLYQEAKPFMPLDKETFIKFRNNWLKYDVISTDDNLCINLKEKGLKQMLAGNFPWEDTPEGHEFWSRIYENL